MAASSSASPAKKRARELNTGNATKGVWLVKVPNYLSDAWQKAPSGGDLGVMKIKSDPSRGAVVTFDLNEHLSKQEGANSPALPISHRVIMQTVSTQSLSVFSEGTTGSQDEIIAEGRITQRADIQPVDSKVYMDLKLHQIKAAGRTKNTVTQLKNAPSHKIKPLIQHPETKTSKQQEKRARDDRDSVLNLIFDAFKSHQYYTFKDLVHKTKQPPSYLKELLKEVCVYNHKAPHKNTWELKAEYKHHSKD